MVRRVTVKLAETRCVRYHVGEGKKLFDPSIGSRAYSDTTTNNDVNNTFF